MLRRWVHAGSIRRIGLPALAWLMGLAGALAVGGVALGGASCRLPPLHPAPQSSVSSASSGNALLALLALRPEERLGDVTLQSALEAAWDGDFLLCYKRARTALTIASDDLETMELMLRCAGATRLLGEAEAWVRAAYAPRVTSAVSRYAQGVGALIRGELPEARKYLARLADEVPVAAYQAAVAAQLDDDAAAAERFATMYTKARPNDPAGRVLHAEVVCLVDLPRCGALISAIRRAGDDEASTIASRVGVAIGAPSALERQTLLGLARSAESIGWAAFSDALALAATLREGADPALVLVRSPRSGRGEPGASVDLARDARATAVLPFATRVTQLLAEGDPVAATTVFARALALFPTTRWTYELARRSERTAALARRELENASFVRWRIVVAAELAHLDETCELANGFPAAHAGPIATWLRARCELKIDPARARRAAEARLASARWGERDVHVAMEVGTSLRDAAWLLAIAHQVARVAPQSTVAAQAFWAAADLAGKSAPALYADALAHSATDPTIARRLLRKYVESRDIARAKAIVETALVEAPLDAYLCGVRGELELQSGNPTGALEWLTKSCRAARARKDTDTLTSTLATIAGALPRVKDKTVREAATKCARGE